MEATPPPSFETGMDLFGHEIQGSHIANEMEVQRQVTGQAHTANKCQL